MEDQVTPLPDVAGAREAKSEAKLSRAASGHSERWASTPTRAARLLGPGARVSVPIKKAHVSPSRASAAVVPSPTPAVHSRRRVQLLWLEKAVALVLVLQRFAVLWAIGKGFPWPISWQKWSRWTLFLALDFVSHQSYVDPNDLVGGVATAETSVYGERRSYWVIVLAWCLTVAALVVVRVAVPWATARWWLHRCRLRRVRAGVQDACLLLGVLLHTPASIALARVYVCDTRADGSRVLTVDPSVGCFGGSHWALMVCTFPFIVGVMVAFPVFLFWHVRSLVVFKSRHKHERYLRWKEVEYRYDICYDWRRHSMWVLSSFRRSATSQYGWWTLSQSVLVGLYAWVRRIPSLQADLWFAVAFVWAARQTLAPAYRTRSSNALEFVAAWTMAVDGWFALMRGHGIRSAVVVDSNFFASMIILNGAALVLAFVAVSSTALVFPDRWPSGLVMDTVSHTKVVPHVSDNSPVAAAGGGTGRDKAATDPYDTSVLVPQPRTYRDDVVDPVSKGAATAAGGQPGTRSRSARPPRLSDITPESLSSPGDVDPEVLRHLEAKWVTAVRDARGVLLSYQFRPPEMVDVGLLMERVLAMRRQWKLARRLHHILAWSLVEAMDSLSALADACRNRTCFNNRRLVPLLPSFAESLHRLDAQYVLVPRVRRRLILKLVALRAWMGRRSIAKRGWDERTKAYGEGVEAEAKADAGPGSGASASATDLDADQLSPSAARRRRHIQDDPDKWAGVGAGGKGRFKAGFEHRRNAVPAHAVFDRTHNA